MIYGEIYTKKAHAYTKDEKNRRVLICISQFSGTRSSLICVCTHTHTHTHIYILPKQKRFIYIYIYIYIYDKDKILLSNAIIQKYICIYIYIYVYIYIYIYDKDKKPFVKCKHTQKKKKIVGLFVPLLTFQGPVPLLR